jgi:predicted 3-demethylubiquinone-9 3-methyltransferase (glyoxalase superfamily)
MADKIGTCLWFDDQAEEAAKFYTSIFKNSKIHTTTHYTEEMSGPSNKPVGSVMTVSFELEGRPFLALNGGPIFKFNESISLIVNCKDQEEIDYYWSNLTADGGEESMCGWLKDKFGLSWQITPENWEEIMKGDSEKAKKALGALMQMKKFDLAEIERVMNS